MNDNDPPKYDWHELIEQEWGHWPFSCTVDELNPKTIHAVFATELRITGEMRIKGYTIVPHAVLLPEPYNSLAPRRSAPKARRLSQNALAFR